MGLSLELTNAFNLQVLSNRFPVCFNLCELLHSVHPPFICWGVEPLTKFSKGVGGGGLDRISIFREVTGKEGVTFLRGVCSFYIKNKLKSEIFNDKESS